MENEINNLLDAIKSDYAKFKGRWIAKDEAMKQRQAKMTDDFNTELGFKVGKKYIKITQRNGGNVIEGNLSWVEWTGPAYLN